MSRCQYLGCEVSERVGNLHGAAGKLVPLKDAHWPIPEDCLAVLQCAFKGLHTSRSNIQTLHQRWMEYKEAQCMPSWRGAMSKRDECTQFCRCKFVRMHSDFCWPKECSLEMHSWQERGSVNDNPNATHHPAVWDGINGDNASGGLR